MYTYSEPQFLTPARSLEIGRVFGFFVVPTWQPSFGGLAPNGCMIVHMIVLGEASLSAENSGKPLAGRGFVPNPCTWGSHSAPQTP